MTEKRLVRLSQTKFHRPNHVSLTYIAQPDYGVTLAQVPLSAPIAVVSAVVAAIAFAIVTNVPVVPSAAPKAC